MVVLGVCTVLLGGCANTAALQTIDAPEAIRLAKANPKGILVKVVFRVSRVGYGTGVEEGRIFLDSESDYRSDKSLNVVVVGDAADAIKKASNGDVGGTYLNKTVEVSGYSEQVQIGRWVDGHSEGPYYYQTQLDVSNPARLRIITE